MPELPEVQTMVNDLNRKVLNRTFLDVWTDARVIVRDFKKRIKGRKIKKIWRRAKNIIFELSGGLFLLVHPKMTGHFLYGEWEQINGEWVAISGDELKDSRNRFLHLVFFLDNKKMLALSDMRRFAKIKLLGKKEIDSELKDLGPEALEITLEQFNKTLKKGKIKQVLMDQKVISGIGNIYSDEILWHSKIHPEKKSLTEKELKIVYDNMKKILNLAVKLKGESFSNFRDIEGKKGFYDKERKAYKRAGQKCLRCGNIIKRIKLGGRSASFCPYCQKL
ncbi:DNA-formamidopyrimidine glycosylase [Patescibacteria group bacterium]|nr:DNA-formamidopyrimidine glycosylase [Patescibacteria group bacterium]